MTQTLETNANMAPYVDMDDVDNPVTIKLSPEETKAIIDNLNESLNPEQKLAAETIYGSVMILAGAGAGKTKTLIHRTATMLISGISPKNIMLVTFTNKAAEEIRERLEVMPEIGLNAQYICVGTFHSIILREIIKKYPNNKIMTDLGYLPHEIINLDDDDMSSLMKEAMTHLSEEDKNIVSNNEWTYNTFLKEMSMARANAYDLKDYIAVNLIGSDNEELARITANLWRKYRELCVRDNGIDFDDILLFADKILQAEPFIAAELSQTFKYLMLDEYQDTNRVQQNIMDAIAQYHKNICTVGDEKQSIYGFRAADINIILGFEKRFENTHKISLNKNYRSYPKIIQYANALSSCMQEKVSEGSMIAEKPITDEADVFAKRKYNTAMMVEFETGDIEALTVSKAIQRDLAVGVEGKEIAVLYRNRSSKKLMEKCLMGLNIPYEVVNDNSLYQSKEVRNAVALLRFMFHPYDNRAAIRLIQSVNVGVSDAAIKDAMSTHGISASKFLREKSQEKLAVASAKKNKQGMYKSHALKLQPLIALQDELINAAFYKDSPAYIVGVIGKIWDIYLAPKQKRDCEKKGKDFEGVKDNVGFIFKRVEDALEQGLTIDEVIEDLSLMVESNPKMDKDKDKKVKLMTMHASKGLEFENVYIINADENTLIGDPDNAEFKDIEEARRLMYVAITRAMKKVSISYATLNRNYGETQQCKKSRFLSEIEQVTGDKVYVVANKNKRNEAGYSR